MITRNQGATLRLACWAIGVLLATPLPGCSMATLGSARPVDVGETQLVVAPAIMRVARPGSPRTAPQFEIGGRYGLTKNVDVGARLWLPLPGYSLDSKVAIQRSASPDRGLDIAIQPGFAYIYAPGGETNDSPLHFVTTQLPLLFGWHFPHGRELIITPKIIDILSMDFSTYGKMLNLVVVGASVGGILPITNTFALAPEIGFGSLILGSISGFGSDLGQAGTNLQISLGLLFGGKTQPALRCTPVSAGDPPPGAPGSESPDPATPSPLPAAATPATP